MKALLKTLDAEKTGMVKEGVRLLLSVVAFHAFAGKHGTGYSHRDLARLSVEAADSLIEEIERTDGQPLKKQECRL